jgi:hypothetical protein
MRADKLLNTFYLVNKEKKDEKNAQYLHHF